MAEIKKVIAHDQWAEKFLRETPFMPFGSMCNLIGQALNGKGEGIDTARLEELASKAFELAMKFTAEAFESVEKVQEEEAEIKIKK